MRFHFSQLPVMVTSVSESPLSPPPRRPWGEPAGQTQRPGRGKGRQGVYFKGCPGGGSRVTWETEAARQLLQAGPPSLPVAGALGAASGEDEQEGKALSHGTLPTPGGVI